MRTMLFTLIFLFSGNLSAGVTTELYLEKHDSCHIEISHDATPESIVGTLIFRSYKVVAGIHDFCEVTPQQIESSLSKALVKLKTFGNLAPITSIVIGEVIDSSWSQTYFLEVSKQHREMPITYSEAGQLVYESPVTKPFIAAAKSSGYSPTGVSCEKVMRFDNGSFKRAFCFLALHYT